MRKSSIVSLLGLLALLGSVSAANAAPTVDLLWGGSTAELADPSVSSTVTLHVIITAGPEGSSGAAITVDYSEAVGAISVIDFQTNPSVGPEFPLILGDTVDTGTEVRNINAASLPGIIGPGLASGQDYLLGFVVFHIDALVVGALRIETTITDNDAILDLAGNDVTGASVLNEAFLISTVPAPALSAAKSDALSDDVAGDAEADPGDTLRYTVVIGNGGLADATSVSFSDTPDPNTTLVTGTVTTSQGTITTGNTSGDTTVEADIGTIPVGGGDVTVEFDVLVGDLPGGVDSVSNQGTVSADSVPSVSTNDPDTLAGGDATVTEVTTPLEACEEEAAACSADLGMCQFDLGTCSADLSTCQVDLGTAEDDLNACLTNPPFEDADGDGEHDDTDACPSTPAGEPVDQAGCSHAEFCAGIDMSGNDPTSLCNRADWGNDEPRRPRDCRAIWDLCIPY